MADKSRRLLIVPSKASQQTVLRPLVSEGGVHPGGGEDRDGPDRGEPRHGGQDVGTDGAKEEVGFLSVDHLYGREGADSRVALSVGHEDLPGELGEVPGGGQDGGEDRLQAGPLDPALTVLWNTNWRISVNNVGLGLTSRVGGARQQQADCHYIRARVVNRF